MSEGLKQWFCVYTKPKCETKVERLLESAAIEVLNPVIRRRNFYRGKGLISDKTPLFPCYIFARFSEYEYRLVKYTRGVRRVVEFGGVPCPISDDIINLIKSRMKGDGSIRIGRNFKRGERVLIMDGPFKDFVGIFEREIPARDRVIILLNTLEYQAKLELNVSEVKSLH